MRALSIRQPYAELILRGIKTVEYRSRATSIIGERFYIYAGKKRSAVSGQLSAWSKELSAEQPPECLAPVRLAPLCLASRRRRAGADASQVHGASAAELVHAVCEELTIESSSH